MRYALAIEIKGVWLLKLFRVAAAGAQNAQDHFTRPQSCLADIDILDDEPRRIDDTEQTDRLIGKSADQCRISPQSCLDIGHLRQLLIGKAGNVGHCIHAAKEKDETHCEYFVFTHRSSADVDVEEMRHQLFVGASALLIDQGFHLAEDQTAESLQFGGVVLIGEESFGKMAKSWRRDRSMPISSMKTVTGKSFDTSA